MLPRMTDLRNAFVVAVVVAVVVAALDDDSVGGSD